MIDNNNTTIEFTVDNPGERLDKLIVAQLPDLSRVQVQTLIHEGGVLVNGVRVKAGIKLRGGETISVVLPDAPDKTVTAENIPLNVVYEDDDLAVIDKAAGMVVHPGVGNETGTLVNALLGRWPQIADMGVTDEDDESAGEGAEGRMGIVHRLDKETSGLLVVAKNTAALHNLMAQFQERTVDKTYLALVERTPHTTTGRIEAAIGRDPKNRKRMAAVRDGRPAVTEYAVIEDGFREGQALIRVKLLTGRTHQIRVHMAFIGSPVVGDTVYGFRKQRIKLKRLFLHAAELCFDHPTTGERRCFESPLPVGLQNTLDKLRE